jgi:hypothetical protein
MLKSLEAQIYAHGLADWEGSRQGEIGIVEPQGPKCIAADGAILGHAI